MMATREVLDGADPAQRDKRRLVAQAFRAVAHDDQQGDGTLLTVTTGVSNCEKWHFTSRARRRSR